MKIKNKTIGIFLLSLIGASNVFAGQNNLLSYDQLVQSLHQGGDVKAIVYMNHCVMKDAPQTAEPMPETDTRLNFNIYSHYQVVDGQQKKYAVATSVTILTDHSVFGPVYAYGRLRVFEDNSAEYYAAYYDPKTYEVKGSADFICKISNGNDQNGLLLLVGNNN